MTIIQWVTAVSLLAGSTASLFAADKFTPIFDGKSLDGWKCRPAEQAGNWTVVDGKIASEVIDNETAKRLDKGFIGFQLHGGDTMVVKFKDIEMKRGK